VDPDNIVLFANVMSGPTNGTVTLNSDGSFEFQPAAGFTGIDSFTYTASDGILSSNPVTVFINVEATPLPPGPGIPPDNDNSNDDNENTDTETTETIPPTLVEPNSLPTEERRGRTRSSAAESTQKSNVAFDFDLQHSGYDIPVIVQERIVVALRQVVESIRANVSPNLVGNMYETDMDWDSISLLRDQLGNSAKLKSVAVGTATAITSAATMGYLIWTVRGGYLMAAMASGVPAWQAFDPLPILQFTGTVAKDDEESLAGLAHESNQDESSNADNS
jgi:hypothetical protein